MCLSQTNIDSLQNILNKTKGADRLPTLIDLSKAHKRLSPEKTVEYALEALKLAKETNNQLLIASALAQAGDGKLLVGLLDTAEIYYRQAYKIYKEQDYFEGLSESYLDLGNICFFNASYDSAAIYYEKAIRIKLDLGENKSVVSLYNNLGAVYKKTGHTDLAIEALENSLEISNQFNTNGSKGLALINLASLYFTRGELLKAMNYNYEALQLAEETNDLYTKSNAFTNLGNIYSFIDDYDNALKYQRIALNIDRKLQDWEGIITAHNNIGNIYLKMNRPDSAEYYFLEALELHQNKNVKIDHETTNHFVGKVYMNKKQYDNALDYINQSLESSTELNDIILTIDNHIALGEIYLDKGNLITAEKHLLGAMDLVEKNPYKDEYKIYLLLSKISQKKNLDTKALSYHIKYSILKDSINSAKRAIMLSELKSSYEIKKQQDKINSLSESSTLQKEKIHKQQVFRNILITGSSIILILLIFQIISFKNKKKANRILKKQNKQIQKQNIEIKQKTQYLSEVNKELEKLSIAASQTDNAILIANPTGEVEWINEGYTRLYGYTWEEFIKEKGTNIKNTSSNANIEQVFNLSLSEKKSQMYEAEIVSKNGKTYHIHTTLTPILNNQNEVDRIIAIDSDITKLKKVENELKQLLVTKDKFFSIIAHDLKNPFNSLMGLAQLLVHGYDRLTPEKVKYFHNNLYQISKNGYELLINLLEWSRSQMGTIHFKPVEISLAAIIEQTFSLYNGKASQKEINLTNSVDEKSTVLADQNMLKTILRNLVSNALKFTERGGAIEISENEVDGFKEITVRDTGIGIKPEDIGKLFKLDHGHTTEGTEDETGTGLGLILYKEFVDKHDGKIWVESKVGFGSKFIFSLPIKK
jgi:PAS domain S-box-containing protein